MGFHRSVALAGRALEALQIEDLDVPPAVTDETGPLELVGDRRNAAPAHAEHLRKKFLRQLQLIASRQIARPQQPSRQPAFHRVRDVACCGFVVFGSGWRMRRCRSAVEAVTLTCFVLIGNTLLRPLVNAINRAPITASATEAIYEVRLTVAAEHMEGAREQLQTQLESANYPIRNVAVVERDDGTVELVATLLGTTADPHELDAVVASFDQNPLVQHTSWNLRTAD
jgi:hypothetical protein